MVGSNAVLVKDAVESMSAVAEKLATRRRLRAVCDISEEEFTRLLDELDTLIRRDPSEARTAIRRFTNRKV